MQFLSFLIYLVIIFSFIQLLHNDVSYADNLIPYHDHEKKIFFLYPEIWVINKTALNEDSVIDINIPYQFTKDDAIPYIQLIVENSTSLNNTLATIVNNNIKEYNSTEPYITIVTDNKPAKLGNYSAIMFEYTFNDNGTDMKAMELTSLIGNKTYYFDYVAGLNDYDILIPQVQGVIKSFQIK